MTAETISPDTLVDEMRKDLLPPSWSASLRLKRSTPSENRALADSRWEHVLSVGPNDGPAASFSILTVPRLEPRGVFTLLRQPRSFPPFVLAPFLSLQTRRRLRKVGASYMDGTGNLYIGCDRPPLLIQRSGSDRNPNPVKRPLRSLKGPAAARVVRALCDFYPPYTVTDVARLSATPKGTVSKIVAFLQREALVERKGRGPVTDVDWRGLITRWSDDYDLLRSNRARMYLNPRGQSALLKALRQWDRKEFRYAVTGLLARIPSIPIVVVSRLPAIYVECAAEAARLLDLEPHPSANNVLLLEPFDPVVFERTRLPSGLVAVAASQAAVDMITGPGRDPSEAVMHLNFMEHDESAWRTREE